MADFLEWICYAVKEIWSSQGMVKGQSGFALEDGYWAESI